MGKIKFKKLKKLRHNPVNLPSTEDVARARVPENLRSDKQLPVISQVRLRNSSPCIILPLQQIRKDSGGVMDMSCLYIITGESCEKIPVIILYACVS